jgi:phospholipase C
MFTSWLRARTKLVVRHTPNGREDRGAMARQIEHVVMIIKENHTFDNYFGTFPDADGVTLEPAQNPPPDDPDHRHEAWMNRGTDTAHRVQYTQPDIPGY